MKTIRDLLIPQRNEERRTLPDNKCTWPSASERIRAAQVATDNGKTWIPARSGDNIRYCINKEAATEFLEEHGEATGCLHKSAKGNLLLQHALTNVNGDDWCRQRPLVQKAFNSRRVRELAQETARSAVTKRTRHTNRVDDVRSLALQVASETMAVAVLSSSHSQRVPAGLSRLFKETLLPIRGDASISNDFRTVVESIVSEITLEDECLAAALLQQKGLSYDEIVSNIHSALLAGTQTIATTLTTAILISATSSSPRSLCHQALKQLPPVATLPRFHEDTIYMVDLLALAHAGQTPCPWGLGARSCPAGSLSVSCVTAALEALGPVEAGSKDWMQHVSYRPTLTFAEPIALQRRSDASGWRRE